MRHLLIALLTQALFANVAFAKKVTVEWKPIKRAVEYEIVIQRETGVVLRKKTKDPVWSGDLPFGTYVYQVRGLDKGNQPGVWSEWKPLVLVPPSPRIEFPENRSRIHVYSSDFDTVLKWSPLPGIGKYAVEIKKDGQAISKSTASQSRFEMKGLESGKYSWTVKPVLELEGSVPEGLKGKTWESPESLQGEFEIVRGTLGTPTLIKPLSSIPVPDDGKVELKWDEVDGAEGYLVRIVQLETADKGKPDLALTRGRARFTKERVFKVRIASEGSYVWGVQAVAHLDSTQNPLARGPEAVGTFNVDRNAVFADDLGYVAVSTLFAPYSYQVVSPSNGVQGSTQASALAFRGSGEYWIKPLFAIGAGVEYVTFSIRNKNFSRETIELVGKFRTKLSGGQFGWSLSPRIGAEYRAYNQIIPSNLSDFSSGVSSVDLHLLGASAGFDIRKQFSHSLGFGAKFSYFYPLAFAGGAPSGSQITDGASYRNFSFGIQGLYWLSQSIGIGAGGYFEMRSIGFTTPNSFGQVEKITMDGAYFFGSVVYRFWR